MVMLTWSMPSLSSMVPAESTCSLMLPSFLSDLCHPGTDVYDTLRLVNVTRVSSLLPGSVILLK